MQTTIPKRGLEIKEEKKRGWWLANANYFSQLWR
jgi:hypothetical protein